MCQTCQIAFSPRVESLRSGCIAPDMRQLTKKLRTLHSLSESPETY